MLYTRRGKQRRAAEAELELVQRHLDAHVNLLSPLRRIPAELMCKIFSEAQPVVPPGHWDMTLSAPWTLLRVCNHWYDTCLTFGPLWWRVCIELSMNGGHLEHPSEDSPLRQPEFDVGEPSAVMFSSNLFLEKAGALLTLQLERSRDASLSIHPHDRITPQARLRPAVPPDTDPPHATISQLPFTF